MPLPIIMKFLDRISPYILPRAHIENKGDYSTVPNLTELVNDAFFLIIIISVVLLILITSVMVYLAVRYRRKINPVAHEVKESLVLEIVWTMVPTVLVFIMFYVGWVNFVPLRKIPQNAMQVSVISRMWSWQFIYENGLKSSTLKVPVGKPVKLTITSDDVLHSLFIPEFRIKEDAVPGMETFLWFSSDREGEFNIFCAEFCGQGHSDMISKVIVMSDQDFHAWYDSTGEKKRGAVAGLSATGLLEDNSCLDCHSTDGPVIVGPTFSGIYKRKTIVITNDKEREIIADENYLINSILFPDADITKGYPDVMPSFEGNLSGEEITLIIEYLKSLNGKNKN